MLSFIIPVPLATINENDRILRSNRIERYNNREIRIDFERTIFLEENEGNDEIFSVQRV